jgi:hypothetical protein
MDSLIFAEQKLLSIMNRIKNFFLSAGILFSGMVLAQPAIKVSEENHDFGEIIEGKMASHEFQVTNTGNQPLIISNVQPSCGCTSPHWTKEAIMPGKIGTVKATYNSSGRPGIFNKSLTIISNTGSPKILHIKGSVVKKEDKVFTEEQKKNSARIALEKTSFSVGKLEVGQKGIARIKVSNKGIDPLEIDNVTSPCGCTTFSMSKGAIKAGESAILEISISPKQKGVFREEVNISSSDINTPGFRVFLEGEAVDSFTPGMKEGAGSNPFK